MSNDNSRPPPARITPGTFAFVLREFQSPENKHWTRLSPGTRENYARVYRLAEHPETLGGLSVQVIRPALTQAFLDGFEDRPGAQSTARAALQAVDKWAIVRDKLPRSIITGTYCVGSEGGHTPWTEGQVALGEEKARADLSRVITLMSHTGQRGSDIVRMRATDIEEQRHPTTGRMHPGIHVMQKKTGLRLWIPFTEVLIEEVREWRREIGPPWFLITKPDGEPYKRTQLSWHWNDQRDNAPDLAPLKEAGLVLHGLRGVCVVRLRKSGASPLHICSMIGMSQPMVTRYSRFADQVDMALAAVHYLNAGTASEQRSAKHSQNRA